MPKSTLEQKAYGKEYRERNRARIRAYTQGRRRESKSLELQRTYGIDIADYERILAEQGGGCAICGTTETVTKTGRQYALALDHAHGTGKARGLLCFKCNVYAGALEMKGIEWVERVLAYLERWAAKA